MTNRLFNSVFEMELRILLTLLANKKSEPSIDRMISMDFITCYAEKFQLPFDSLHGNNRLMYGEMANRRVLAQEAIKSLVTQGFVNVTVNKGYYYCISSTGEKYIKSLTSEYSQQYLEIAKEVSRVFKKYSDLELEVIIHDNALNSERRGK